MLDRPSKPIKKGDDESKQLIIELLDGQDTGGFDVDSIYKIGERWIVLEFLKCDTVRPFQSHPNRYWFKNAQKFISLWALAQDLKGSLFLLNYEDNREQFLLIEVLGIDEKEGITKENRQELTLKQVKDWFKKLNKHAI